MKFAVHAGRAKLVSPDSTSMLDFERASGGRLPSDPNSCFARWSEVVELANTATNFGISHPPHDERYAIAEEFIDVVKGLWDSWDDGA